MDFIRAFVSSPEKVTAAISKAAVPASADRGSAACCRAAGGVLAGQSCFSQLSHTALHPQGSRPPGPVSPPLTLPLSLSVPRLPGRGPEDEVSPQHLHPVQNRQAPGLVTGPRRLLPQLRAGREYQGEGTPGASGEGGKAPRHQHPGRTALGRGEARLWWHWVLAAARSHPACALQVLLEEEPRDQLCTAVRQQAMLAIAELRYLPIPPGDP